MRPATSALALALLLVAVAFAVPSFSRPAAAADLTGMYGGNLRMALLAAPSWNPLSGNLADAKAHDLVWDTLARPDPVTGEPKPWAAQSWTVNRVAGTNNGTIVATLRPGLMWSDGTPIGAADVAYSFGPNGYAFSTSFSGSDVTFTFTDPDGPAGPLLGNAGRFYTDALYGWIAWTSTGARKYSGMFAPDPLNANRLLANTHFWAGRPYLDSVEIVVASSLDDAACRLLKKRVDFIGFPLLPTDLSDERTCGAYGGFTDPLTGQPVNKSLVNPNGSRSEPHVTAVHHTGPRFMFYWLNVAGGGVLSDVNFRRALYLFVNKQLSIQIEPSSAVTHSLINRNNAFWYLPSWEVIRDAGFTTIRDPLGTPRQDTNPFPGMQALDSAGYLDRDADGWRQTPTGATFSLDIGVVGFNVDPRKTTIMGAYVTVLQRAGVNANLVTFSDWASLRAAEAAGTVDIALESADTATLNPRFLETFAPLQAASVLTDSDARNVITHTNLGKNSFTIGERALHFNHVTYYNSLCACVLPVIHYETLEAADRDTFSGWVDSFGGVNNVWSFSNLRAPHLGPLTIGVSTFTRTVTSGGQTTVQVVVTDENGAAVEDAMVELSASPGAVLAAPTGMTDVNGRYSTSLTAPSVAEDVDVSVWATVSKPQYGGGTETTDLTVRAPFRALDVTVSFSDSDLGAGEQATVIVSVRSGGTAVQGATVTLVVSLPGGELGATSGTTDSAGEFQTTFEASPKIRSIYRVDATASAAGYESGDGTGSAIVDRDFGTYQTLNVTENVPGFEAVMVLAAIGAAVLILRGRKSREG